MKPIVPSASVPSGRWPAWVWTLLAFAVLRWLPAPAAAQIYYTAGNSTGSLHLAQINGDGTGNAAISLPFSTVQFPTWTRNGQAVAVTVANPSFPGEHSQNIFAFTPSTGALTPLTHFQDLNDPTTQSFSYTFPNYKAFSRDGTLMAVFSIAETGGAGDMGGGGVVDLPVLEIYSLTAAANPIEVLVDTQKNGKHHGGDGVDWSPTQNVLAAPLESSAPFQSGGGNGETTAIFLIDPVTAARQTGHLRQITAPRADANISNGTAYGEHDYMPKFSPDGTRLAYVRSFQSQNLTTSLTPNPDIQALRILNLNTGADTQIADFFPQGVYITALDWSPDGSELVCDLGLQPNSPVGPLQQADPGTDQVYLINTNGTGLHQLLGNGAGQPSWRPLGNTAATHPAFFTGEAALSNGVFFLRFPGGNPFGYYSYLTDPHYIFHFDLGYEYVFDAADGKSGVYLYDFKSQGFFYSSPAFPFPYLYDFSLNTVLYYYPDPNNAEHYNTNGVRYFYNFATGKIISK